MPAEAEAVFAELETLLKLVLVSKHAKGCSNQEIEKHCGAFKCLLQQWGVLLSLCQQPCGSLTVSELNIATKVVDCMDNLCHCLMPTVSVKAHIWL